MSCRRELWLREKKMRTGSPASSFHQAPVTSFESQHPVPSPEFTILASDNGGT